MEKDKYLEPLHEILNKDCIEKLRIVDPRVHNYSLYTKVTNDEVNKIKNAYNDVKIQYTLLKKIKTISTVGKEGFTIYNVIGKKRERLIKKHDKEHEKALKKVSKEGIIF